MGVGYTGVICNVHNDIGCFIRDLNIGRNKM